MVKSFEPKAYIDRKVESRWDWNFWNEKIDSNLIKAPFVNIKGDWKTDFEIIKNRDDFNKDSYRKSGKIQEAIEMQEFAGRTIEDRWIGSRVDSDGAYPDFEKIVNSLKMKNTRTNLHIQNPGQMHMMHMDVNYGGGKAYNHLSRDEQKDKVVRIFIMLADWYPGQVITIGNVDYTKWKKGDCAYFNWFDIPHGTANFGHHARPLLFVSGETTPEFNEILHNDNIKQLIL